MSAPLRGPRGDRACRTYAGSGSRHGTGALRERRQLARSSRSLQPGSRMPAPAARSFPRQRDPRLLCVGEPRGSTGRSVRLRDFDRRGSFEDCWLLNADRGFDGGLARRDRATLLASIDVLPEEKGRQHFAGRYADVVGAGLLAVAPSRLNKPRNLRIVGTPPVIAAIRADVESQTPRWVT